MVPRQLGLFESHTVLLDTATIGLCCEFEIGVAGLFVCRVERWRPSDEWRLIGQSFGGMAPWFIEGWPFKGKNGLRLANRVGQELFSLLREDTNSMWHGLATGPKIPRMQSL